MNTNSNAYTVIYTTLVVVVVAAVLAFTAMKLKPSQSANAKAETLRQMMSAAGIKSTDELYATKNADVLQLYADNIEQAYTIGLNGEQNGTLAVDKANIELVDNLKPQNKGIKDNAEVTLPVYVFKSGVAVIPIYGAGLWGPIWGYVAFQPDHYTIAGAYFDHESETPGLGAKIKDEAWFREQFVGKTVNFANADQLFRIVKGGAPKDDKSAVDAITGATMTCNGLDAALNTWFKAYMPFLQKKAGAAGIDEAGCCGEGCCGEGCDGDHEHCNGEHNHQHNHQEG